MIQRPSVRSRDLTARRSPHQRLVLGGARVLSTFLLAVAAVVPIAASPATAATPCPVPAVSWDAPGDGAWTVPANWSGDTVPTSVDDVCIPAGVTVTVSSAAAANRLFSEGTVQVDASVDLTLSGPSEVERIDLMGTVTGAGSLTIVGTGSTWSSGRIETGVVVAAGADLDITGNTVTQAKTVAATLTNDGTITQSGIQLTLGTVVNNGTWLLTYPFAATTMRGGAFTNNGLVERPAGAGDTLVDIISSVDFINNGSIVANDGTVQIGNLIGAGDGASFAAAASKELWIASRDGATVGNATVGGDGDVEFRFGAYSINAGAALTVVDAFILRGGDVQGPGILSVTGEGRLRQGEISGEAVVEPSGHLTIDTAGSRVDVSGRLVNNGLVTQPTAGLYAGPDHGSITNNALWQLTNATTSNFMIRGLDGTGSFVNNGTLEGSETAPSTGLHTSLDLENNGTVASRSGQFRIDTASANLAGTTLRGGRWEMRDGATMLLPGAVTVNDAELALSGATAGSPELAGLTRNTGRLELAGGAIFSTTGDFVNDGAVVAGSGSSLIVNGLLTLGSGSVLDVGVGGPPASGQFGRVTSSGAASLGGTLAAHAVGGYVPGVGDAYEVMSYASMGGGFTTIAADPFYDADVQAAATFLVGIDAIPIADAGPGAAVSEGDTTVLDGSGSTDPGGAIMTWSWAPADWFIDNTAVAPTFIHTPDDGAYTVTLTVCDAAVQCDSADVTVTVDNVAPVVVPVAPLSVDEGTAFAPILATFDDPGSGDTHRSSIDWGDGSVQPGPVTSPIVGPHVYQASGTYTVTVIVTDDDGGSDEATVEVTVDNVAPTVIPASPSIEEGDASATVLAGVDDPGIETFTGSMNWADGSPADTSIAVNAANQAVGGHAYADNGAYPGNLCVTDADGASGCASINIVVTNVAPTVAVDQPSLPGLTGTPITITGTYTDPGAADTHAASVDWQDGSFDVGGVVSGGAFSLDHVYASPGTYAVDVCIVDDDGDEDCEVASVEVVAANTPPAVDAGGPYRANEGQPITIAGTAVDADPGDTVVWTEWRSDPAAMLNTPSAPRTTFLAVQDGTYDVTLTAADTEGETASDTTQVVVSNVGPTIGSRIFDNTFEGSAVEFRATFTDPGVLDVHTAEVDWFDGAGLVPATVDQDLDTIFATHRYAQDGRTEVNLCVSDELATQCNATHIAILNVAPSIDPFSLVGADTEGSTVALTTTVTDPGALDPLSATIDWGEGAGPQPLLVTRTGAGGTIGAANRYQQDGVYSIEVCVSDDDETTCRVESLTITNVPPVVTPIADQTIDEGDTFGPATLASFTDPGTTDPHWAMIDWGEGAGPEPATIIGTAVAGANHYEQEGDYPVTIAVTDDDDTAIAGLTIHVRNVAPDVDAGPDASIAAGGSVSLAASFTDPGADTWTATVLWGDGTAQQPATIDAAKSISARHTYPDGGTFTASVCVWDGTASGCDTFTVIVTAIDVPPIADAGGPYSGDEGALIRLDGSRSRDDDGEIVAYHWTAIGGTFDDPEAATPLFTAMDNRTYVVTLTVTDDDGNTDSASATVKVDNVAPKVSAGRDRTITRGQSFRFDAAFSDPGLEDTHRATIAWGDGSSTDIDNATSPVGREHRFAKPGRYTVTVTVVDDDGGASADTMQLTVEAASKHEPRARTGGPYKTAEGSWVHLDGSRSADEDGHIVSYRWTANGGAFDDPTSARPRFRAKDDGTFTVTLEVTDDDGLTDTARTTVTVWNAKPSVDAGKDATIAKGEQYRLEAVFSDPGKADTHRAVIDWGDGTKHQIDNATSPIRSQHRYAKPGRYTVRVTVIDDDGGKKTDKLTVTVNQRDKKNDEHKNDKQKDEKKNGKKDAGKKDDGKKDDGKKDRKKGDDKGGEEKNRVNGEKAREEKNKPGGENGRDEQDDDGCPDDER